VSKRREVRAGRKRRRPAARQDAIRVFFGEAPIRRLKSCHPPNRRRSAPETAIGYTCCAIRKTSRASTFDASAPRARTRRIITVPMPRKDDRAGD
jgi:hypothetical protein